MPTRDSVFTVSDSMQPAEQMLCGLLSVRAAWRRIFVQKCEYFFYKMSCQDGENLV